MSDQEQPSSDVLKMPRAYVRVDRHVVAALPELDEAIRAFEPVAGPAGYTDAYWREQWGMRASEQRVPGNRALHRLWMAIPA